MKKRNLKIKTFIGGAQKTKFEKLLIGDAHAQTLVFETEPFSFLFKTLAPIFYNYLMSLSFWKLMKYICHDLSELFNFKQE